MSKVRTMSWLIALLFLLVALTVGLTWRALDRRAERNHTTHTWKYESDWGLTLGLAFWLCAVVGVGMLAIMGIRAWVHSTDARNCRSFGEETQLEARFIDVSYWDFGCYVRAGEEWVKRDHVRLVLDGVDVSG